MRIQNLNDPTKAFNHFSGDYQARHFIEDGDILLSWSGTPGTSFGCFRWMRGPALLNQHIFKVHVDSQTMDGDFFIHAVNSRLDEMVRQAHGDKLREAQDQSGVATLRDAILRQAFAGDL